MGKKHRMLNSVIIAIKHNKDGACCTQADRRQSLIHTATTLHAFGYPLDPVRFMKSKPIHSLDQHWQAHGVGVGSIENRMCHLRWLLHKFDGKDKLVPSNDQLGITERIYVSQHDKSRSLSAADFSQINDPLM